LILSKDGAKEALVDLSPSLYKQPEGICFTPDGNLFISSEGDGGDGYILKFDYKNKIVTVKQTSHYNQIAGQPIIYNSQFITINKSITKPPSFINQNIYEDSSQTEHCYRL